MLLLTFHVLNLLLISIVYLLVRYNAFALGLFILLTSFCLTVNFIQTGQYEFHYWGHFLKVLCTMPLGLGSIVAYQNLSKEVQLKYFSVFTLYVNCAVVFNIIMMIFLPLDGSLRGISSRFTCVLLVIWLLMEMRKVKWRTVKFEENTFLFVSSPLSWVCCHAVYRTTLVTLPSFQTSRYFFFLEFSSLFVMFRLYYTNRCRYPISYYFGLSDTIVVATFAFASALFEIDTEKSNFDFWSSHSDLLDLILVPWQGIVSFIAIMYILFPSPVELVSSMNKEE